MKKLIALLLALAMVVGAIACAKPEAPAAPAAPASPATPAEPANPLPDWAPYDEMIATIKSTTDFAERAKLMHEAEDYLMDTGAILPIYYYNDLYMMKPGIEGFYSNPYGTKYFMYTTFGDVTTLRVNLASEPDRLDPALNSSVDGACLAANSFGGLYTYDNTGAVIPNFAESYEMSEDGLTYTFKLKAGLKWSDGSDLTAEDFVYSWKRASSAETGADYAYMFNVIAGYGTEEGIQVSAPDAATVVVTLAAPCAYMLDLVAFPTYFPVKKDVVENAKGYKDAAGAIIDAGAWATEAGFVSSGAYVLKEWKHNESMVYEKNPNWYDAANVKIERIEFMLSADDTAIYTAYQNGDLDFIDTVPTDEIANLIATNNPEFYVIDELGTYYICFNVKSPLFEGKTAEEAANMRKAFGLLVDRQYIIDTVGQTGQKLATSFIPAEMLDGAGGVFKDAANWSYPNGADGYYGEEVDEEGAIEMLEAAGFKFVDGKLDPSTPISFEYLTNESSGHVAIAECVQQDLAVIGINMTIKSIDWDTFLAERKAGNYDIARNGWIADFNDPINMLEMWTTDSGNNDCQFGR